MKIDSQSIPRGRNTLQGLLVLFFFSISLYPSWGLSKFRQSSLPQDLQSFEAAILDENTTFVTLMTERSIRVIETKEVEIVSRDPEGDKDFVRDHRNENGDYWYWTHQKAREALILSLGNQPAEAIQVIDTIPYNEALVPEYQWIVTPEFKEYLSKAKQDLAYYMDPYLGVAIFFTNYQVDKLDLEYPSTGGGRENVSQIPMLEVNPSELVETGRQGEEPVGLDAILDVDPDGITDSLLPSSPEFADRKTRLQERLITASDLSLKRIPVATREIRDLLQEFMQEENSFLKIEGSMRSDSEGTRFSEDLRVVVNENSPRAQFLSLHRLALGGSEVKRAE